jgi:putative DNA primase/helicase
VEKWRPTVLIDEADTFIRDNDDLRGILNSGHHRGNAFVLRLTGDYHEPTRFCTWAPKVVALIGKLPPTLASRAIHVQLKRMLSTDRIYGLRIGKTRHLDPLKQKAMRWAADHDNHLRAVADPKMPEALYGRAADNWRPLIAIADLAGGNWPARARDIAQKFAGRYEDVASVMVLHDIRAIFIARGVDRLPSAEIIEVLSKMEDRPWPEWKNGKPITARQVAKLLDPFGVVPVTITLSTGKTPKGYHLRAFNELVKRYPLSQSAIPPQVSENNDFGDFESAAPKNHLAVLNAEKSQKSSDCGGTADKASPGANLLWDDNARDRFEERAAILEYEAGLTRAEAEARAAQEICLELPDFLDRRSRVNER